MVRGGASPELVPGLCSARADDEAPSNHPSLGYGGGLASGGRDGKRSGAIQTVCLVCVAGLAVPAVRALFRIPTLRGVYFAYGMNSFIAWAVLAWLPVYLALALVGAPLGG